MAGHSKWKNIKHKKAKEDAKRGKAFTKLTKEIFVCARGGGGDPESNAKLRLLLEKAKQINMPKENVDRAIKKGTGQLEGVNYESATYEGYGPNNVAVIVETLTDNKNRTVSDLRHFFNKNSGRLAENGSVAWMFENKGQVTIEGENLNEENLLEKLLEAPVDDIVINDENNAEVYCGTSDLDSLRKEAEAQGLNVKEAEIVWVPNNPLSVEGSDEEKVFEFLDQLDDIDDVQEVFANIK